MNYTLELSESEVNLILNTLAARPYGEVYQMIYNITEQIKKTHGENPIANPQ